MTTQSQDSPPAGETPTTLPRRVNWLWFFLMLLLPPVLSLLASLARSQNFPAVVTLFGSPAAGIFCGIQLGRYLTKTPGGAIGMSLLFIVVFTVLIFMLCAAGCAVGGFELIFDHPKPNP